MLEEANAPEVETSVVSETVLERTGDELFTLDMVGVRDEVGRTLQRLSILSQRSLRDLHSPHVARRGGSGACRHGGDRAAPVSNLYRRTDQRAGEFLTFQPKTEIGLRWKGQPRIEWCSRATASRQWWNMARNCRRISQ